MAKSKRKIGRPKLYRPPEILRRAVLPPRGNLLFAMLILGKRAVAEEMIRRRKIECRQAGKKYNRAEAIEAVAGDLGLDVDGLTNWLNRSKRARGEG